VGFEVNILILMIPMALLLGVGFVLAFFWAARKGQFDDLDTPAMRILNEENRFMNSKQRKESELENTKPIS